MHLPPSETAKVEPAASLSLKEPSARLKKCTPAPVSGTWRGQRKRPVVPTPVLDAN